MLCILRVIFTREREWDFHRNHTKRVRDKLMMTLYVWIVCGLKSSTLSSSSDGRTEEVMGGKCEFWKHHKTRNFPINKKNSLKEKIICWHVIWDQKPAETMMGRSKRKAKPQKQEETRSGNAWNFILSAYFLKLFSLNFRRNIFKINDWKFPHIVGFSLLLEKVSS